VSDFAFGGSSATCWGQYHVADRLPADAAAVAIAYGTNDITGDYFGCRGTIEDFRMAIRSMLEQARSTAPSAALYVLAILPRTDQQEAGSAVPEWNAVLAEEAATAGAAFVDAGPIFDPATDSADGLHPTAAGHVELASVYLEAFD